MLLTHIRPEGLAGVPGNDPSLRAPDARVLPIHYTPRYLLFTTLTSRATVFFSTAFRTFIACISTVDIFVVTVATDISIYLAYGLVYMTRIAEKLTLLQFLLDDSPGPVPAMPDRVGFVCAILMVKLKITRFTTRYTNTT